jgi:hypothetical protein
VGKNYRHISFVPFRQRPLRWLAPPPFPLFRGALWVLGISDNWYLWQQRRENHTTGLRPLEMHPFWCLRHHLPPEGGLLAALCNEQFKLTQGESIVQISPSGGDAVGRRGAFPRAPGAVGLFFFARQGGFMVLLAHQYTSPLPRFYQNWRRRRPLQPSEPFEPSEPSRPKGVSKKALTKAAAGSFL